MAALTTTTLRLDAQGTTVNPGLAAADALGDTVTSAAGTLFIVQNTGVSSVDVTITSTFTAVPGAAPANVVVAVPAGATRILKLSSNENFRNSEGIVEIDYADATDLLVAAVK